MASKNPLNQNPIFLQTGGDSGSILQGKSALSTGRLSFVDKNLSDTHAVTITPGVVHGSVSARLAADSTQGKTGSIDWTYKADTTFLKGLGAGETATDYFKVTVADANGGAVSKAVTVTLTGINDAVQLRAGSKASGEIVQGSSKQSVGTLSFTDADLHDAHKASISSSKALHGNASVVVSADSMHGKTGAADWNYIADAGFLQSLGAGKSVTDHFTVSIDDGHGGAVKKDIAVKLTGVNDAVQFFQDTYDIFMKDSVTGATTQINSDSFGNSAIGGYDYFNGFSSDGTKALFSSEASNLVVGDTNAVSDVFLKDLITGATTRVSTDSTGAQAIGSGGSYNGTFSKDGTKVLFDSDADNLVPGDTNGTYDVFLKDLVTGKTSPVSLYDLDALHALGFFKGAFPEVGLSFEPAAPHTFMVGGASGIDASAGPVALRDFRIGVDALSIFDSPNAKKQAVTVYTAFSDADVGDVHTVNVDRSAHYGVLTTSLREPDASGNGAVSYTYTVDNAIIHNLALDKTVHDTFHVTLDDGHGSTVTQDLTFDLVHPSAVIA